MYGRSLLRLGVLASLLGVACAAEPTEPSAPSAVEDDEFRSEALRELTVVKGKVRPGETATIPYEPTSAAYEPAKARGRVPFLAVELVRGAPDAAQGSPGAEPKTVKVEGHFPGTPRVIVVDENFRRVAAADAVAVNGIERAELTASLGEGKRFVLVRDGLWTAPMTFDVTVGR